MTPLIVMAAPTGARRTKADHPNLPLTTAEIAAEAARCAEAGARVLHLHVRDEGGRHTLDPGAYRKAIAAIRAEVGDALVLQITTEAVGLYDVAEQMAVVRELRPEAVSLALRELIPGDEALKPAGAFLTWLRDEGIAPQFILYGPMEVARFHELRRRLLIPQASPFALFVLGRYMSTDDLRGLDVRPRDLLPFLRAHELDAPWSVCAFGIHETACVITAAGLGGHIRVGFENNLWHPDGTLASGTAALVAQVTGAAGLLGRPVADIAETRRFLAETAA